MSKIHTFSSEELQSFAHQCHESMTRAPSRYEALKEISETASELFGDYFGANILKTTDELSVRFVELLDQIIFEIEENNHVDAKIREYISNDLYERLNIYLESFIDLNIYKKNLKGRLLREEDLVVISHHEISEYLPILMDEYYEQPALQKSILKKLIQFDSDELLHFYYSVVKEKNCIEVIILSLIGLKKNVNRFNNWRHLKTEDDDFNHLVEYIEQFNLDSLYENDVPTDVNTLIAALFILEMKIDSITGHQEISWMIEVLNTLSRIALDNTNVYTLQVCVSNILVYFDPERLREILVTEDLIVSFIHLCDFLPQDLFSRITFKLSMVGEDFLMQLKKMLESDRVKLKRNDSNILTFLMWETQTIL